jgi:hypothetical protein
VYFHGYELCFLKIRTGLDLNLLPIVLKADSDKPKAATGGTKIMQYDKDKVDEFTLALP